MKKTFLPDARPDRMKSVSSLLQEVLSEIISRELKDPRIGSFVTVTNVDVARDLRSARVYVSSIDDTRDMDKAVAGLESAKSFIRRRVAQEVTMRQIPVLTFVADNTIKHGVQMCELITNLREEDAKLLATEGEVDGDENERMPE